MFFLDCNLAFSTETAPIQTRSILHFLHNMGKSHLVLHLCGLAREVRLVVSRESVKLAIEANLLARRRNLGIPGDGLADSTRLTDVDAAVRIKEAVVARASVHGALESTLVGPTLDVVAVW